MAAVSLQLVLIVSVDTERARVLVLWLRLSRSLLRLSEFGVLLSGFVVAFLVVMSFRVADGPAVFLRVEFVRLSVALLRRAVDLTVPLVVLFRVSLCTTCRSSFLAR